MGLRKFLSTLGGTVTTAGMAGVAPSVDVPAMIDPTPDSPVGFGYKSQWFAAKSADARAVTGALGLATPLMANWASGLAAVSQQDIGGLWVFVTPSIDGWVFVVGRDLGSPDQRTVRSAPQQRDAQTFDRHFTALYGRFPDVQFYGSHRATGYAAWARAVNGRVVRIFATADSHVLANVGQQTAEESLLKLPNLSGLSLPAAERALQTVRGRRVVDEEAVLMVAGSCALNPMQIEQYQAHPSVGTVARLP